MVVRDELAELIAEQAEEMIAEWPHAMRSPLARKVVPRLLAYRGDDAVVRSLALQVAQGDVLKSSQLSLASERMGR